MAGRWFYKEYEKQLHKIKTDQNNCGRYNSRALLLSYNFQRLSVAVVYPQKVR